MREDDIAIGPGGALGDVLAFALTADPEQARACAAQPDGHACACFQVGPEVGQPWEEVKGHPFEGIEDQV